MANQNVAISASDYTTLKTLIDQEIARRKYVGSVTPDDFSVQPASGGQIKVEHYNVPRGNIAKINASLAGVAASSGTQITAQQLNNLSSAVATLKGYKETDSTTGCDASCTGLCKTGCATNCTGSCTGTCQGCTGCSDACAAWCSVSCRSACSSGCQACAAACANGCGGSCYTGDCTGTCLSGLVN